MKDESLEILRNVAVAAMASVPLVGGSASVLMDKFLPDLYEKRKAETINQIIKDLEQVSEDVLNLRMSEDDYYPIVIKIIRRMVEENRQEKILAFRNILLNRTLSTQLPNDQVSFFIRIVDNLTVDQMILLKGIYDMGQENPKFLYGKSFRDYADGKLMSDDDEYVIACSSELMRYFIIQNRGDGKNKYYFFTKFGKKFVNYIFGPLIL